MPTSPHAQNLPALGNVGTARIRSGRRSAVARKQGWGCKALCPFRDDKTPSLSIDPKKGLYKCFGCGKAGDSLTFLQEHAKLSFSEAVAELRRHAGIQPAQAQPVPNTKEKEVPIYGAQGMPRDFGDMLLVAGVREISSCLDADKAGKEATRRFSVFLSERGFRSHTLELADAKISSGPYRKCGSRDSVEKPARRSFNG